MAAIIAPVANFFASAAATSRPRRAPRPSPSACSLPLPPRCEPRGAALRRTETSLREVIGHELAERFLHQVENLRAP